MDDRTKIPIGWIFALLGGLITAFCFAGGVIVRGAQLEDHVTQHQERILKVEAVQDQYGKDQQEIRESLARIEGYLKRPVR